MKTTARSSTIALLLLAAGTATAAGQQGRKAGAAMDARMDSLAARIDSLGAAHIADIVRLLAADSVFRADILRLFANDSTVVRILNRQGRRADSLEARVAALEGGGVPPPGPDSTPPTAPSNLAGATDTSSAHLDWEASIDTESGVNAYRVARDGLEVGQTDGVTLAWTDTGLSPSTDYTYSVAAENGEGLIGPAATIALRTTDRPPPPSGGDTALVVAADSLSVTIEARWAVAPSPVTEALITRPADLGPGGNPRLNDDTATPPYTFTAPRLSSERWMYVAVERWSAPPGTLGRTFLGNQVLADSLHIAAAPSVPPPPPECSDTVDNDGDLLTDFPADPDCTSATDTSESSAAPPPTGGGSMNFEAAFASFLNVQIGGTWYRCGIRADGSRLCRPSPSMWCPSGVGPFYPSVAACLARGGVRADTLTQPAGFRGPIP